MATRKSREFKTGPRPKQRKSKIAGEYPFPSLQERLPSLVAGDCNTAMGDGEKIVTWLGGFPQDTQVILISFPNEASYRTYGPTFWNVVRQLPEVVARIRRRRFEQLVDALMQLTLRQDQSPRRPKRRHI